MKDKDHGFENLDITKNILETENIFLLKVSAC